MGVFCLLLLVSCDNSKSKQMHAVNLNVNSSKTDLQLFDTLVVCKEEYPRSMNVFGDWLCVTMAKSDTCLYLYDKKSGELVKRMGIIGMGPEDVMLPEFVKNAQNMNPERLMMYDLNAKKYFFLNKNASFDDFSPLNTQYAGMNSLNITERYIVGHQISGENSLFQIVKKDSKEVKSVDFYPELPNSVTDKIKRHLNYLYSPHIMCNEEKNRIVVPMYFFDLIQIYDFNGDLLKIVNLGGNDDYVKNINHVLYKEDYRGCSQCYLTKDFCYLSRDLYDGKTGKKVENEILKMDWDGNIVQTIKLSVTLAASFCVENDHTLYLIVQNIVDDEEEYLILSYHF